MDNIQVSIPKEQTVNVVIDNGLNVIKGGKPTGVDLTGYVKSEDADNKYATKESTYTKEEVDSKVADLASKESVEAVKEKLDGIQVADVSDLNQIKADIESMQNNLQDKVDNATLDSKIQEVEQKIPSVDGFALKSDIPDTSNLATKEEVPSVADFVTNEALQTKLNALPSNSINVDNAIENIKIKGYRFDGSSVEDVFNFFVQQLAEKKLADLVYDKDNSPAGMLRLKGESGTRLSVNDVTYTVNDSGYVDIDKPKDVTEVRVKYYGFTNNTILSTLSILIPKADGISWVNYVADFDIKDGEDIYKNGVYYNINNRKFTNKPSSSDNGCIYIFKDFGTNANGIDTELIQNSKVFFVNTVINLDAFLRMLRFNHSISYYVDPRFDIQDLQELLSYGVEKERLMGLETSKIYNQDGTKIVKLNWTDDISFTAEWVDA